MRPVELPTTVWTAVREARAGVDGLDPVSTRCRPSDRVRLTGSSSRAGGTVRSCERGSGSGWWGGLAGTILALILFVFGVSLVAMGGSPAPDATGFLPPLLAGVAGPCAAGGMLLFAFPPVGGVALLARLGLSTLGAALYGVVLLFGMDALDGRHAGVAIAVVAGVLSVPLWLLALVSLGIGRLFFRAPGRSLKP